MNATQLKHLIEKTLKAFGYYSYEAVDLLMLTAAQESLCGHYITQLHNGPAKGIFQMEPNTLSDIIDNYLRYKPKLYSKINNFIAPVNLNLNLHGNLLFQIVIARVHYLRIPEKIPVKYSDEYAYIERLAKYWKTYWNTYKGEGTINQAIQNYNKYIRNGT